MTPPLESAPLPGRVPVLIVGAGLTGLACARHLQASGVQAHVLERESVVGGRVRTDEVDGYRIDRGFQVLLAAYDEVWRLVDRTELDVHAFEPGSIVMRSGRGWPLGDPFRRPTSALSALRAPVGSLADKLRVARLRRSVTSRSPERSFDGPARTTLAELQALGFSSDFIDAFFRPFLGGVFLDRELEAPAALFRYLFRCFSVDDAVIPRGGMGRLPHLIARPLAGQISLGVRVAAVRADGVTLDDGQVIAADHVVVATDGVDAAHLLSSNASGTPEQSAADPEPQFQEPRFKSTVTAWFAAPRDPVGRPLLVLDGDGTGPVNHLAVTSSVAPDLAPAGMSLIAASGVNAVADDPGAFAEAARPQLQQWFGPEVEGWRHLHTHHIPRALPRQAPGATTGPTFVRRRDGLLIAGDSTSFGAIQGALRAGRDAAEHLVRLLDAAPPGAR